MLRRLDISKRTERRSAREREGGLRDGLSRDCRADWACSSAGWLAELWSLREDISSCCGEVREGARDVPLVDKILSRLAPTIIFPLLSQG